MVFVSLLFAELNNKLVAKENGKRKCFAAIGIDESVKIATT